MTTDRGFAAVFVDFENVYYELKRMAPNLDVTDYILTVIRGLRIRIDRNEHASPIIIKAYADFERLDSSPQGSLYLMGVETHNVMGTEHKNAADMRLCIDTLEVLYTRPEIHTFVLVAGDRDYIPVVQHLRRQGKNVIVSSFRSNLSGDLLQNIEYDKFIDAFDLLSEEDRREIELARQRKEEADAQRMEGAALRTQAWAPVRSTNAPYSSSPSSSSTSASPAPNALPGAHSLPAAHSSTSVSTSALGTSGFAGGVPHYFDRDKTAKLPLKLKPTPADGALEPPDQASAPGSASDTIEMPTYKVIGKMEPAFPAVVRLPDPELDEELDEDMFRPELPVEDETTRRCLEIMLEHFGRHREIWMSPLLWKLSNAMPLLADFERKILIGNLQNAGAIKILKRKGETHDYSAVIINYNHQSVRECMP